MYPNDPWSSPPNTSPNPQGSDKEKEPPPVLVKETLEIAGRVLPCEKAVIRREKGLEVTLIHNWMCQQIPGFLAKSYLKIESDNTLESTTELIDFEAVPGYDTAYDKHPWGCFGEESWVQLKTTTKTAVDDTVDEQVTELKQTLIQRTPTHVRLAVEVIGQDHTQEIEIPLEPEEQDPTDAFSAPQAKAPTAPSPSKIDIPDAPW